MSTTALTNAVLTAPVLTTPTAPAPAAWGDAPARAARRPRRLDRPFGLDWEACAVSLLMLSSAGAAVCRLLWMGQL